YDGDHVEAPAAVVDHVAGDASGGGRQPRGRIEERKSGDVVSAQRPRAAGAANRFYRHRRTGSAVLQAEGVTQLVHQRVEEVFAGGGAVGFAEVTWQNQLRS